MAPKNRNSHFPNLLRIHFHQSTNGFCSPHVISDFHALDNLLNNLQHLFNPLPHRILHLEMWKASALTLISFSIFKYLKLVTKEAHALPSFRVVLLIRISLSGSLVLPSCRLYSFESTICNAQSRESHSCLSFLVSKSTSSKLNRIASTVWIPGGPLQYPVHL